MFCTQCGAKVREGAAFCTGCGARIKVKPVEAPKVAEEPKIVEKNEVVEEPPKAVPGFSIAGSLDGTAETPKAAPAPKTTIAETVAKKAPPAEAPGAEVIFSTPAPKAEPACSAPAPRTTPIHSEPAPKATPVHGSAPAYGAPAPRPAAPANPMTTDWNHSFFDGGLLGLIGVNIVVFLVSLITLGFAWPSLTCYRLRWVYKHTCIGGYRLRFTGKGIQLFGRFWLWVLLSIVTLTIYTWWVPIKYKQWETKHVVIDSMIPRGR